jgi:hypothetical protein
LIPPVTAGVVNRRLEIIEQVFLVAQGSRSPARHFTCNAETQDHDVDADADRRC